MHNLHKTVNEIEFGIEHFDNFSVWSIFHRIVVHLSSSLLHQTCFSPFLTQPQITILAATPYHPRQPMIYIGSRKIGEICCDRGKIDKIRMGRDVGKMENYCIFETLNMNFSRIGSMKWNSKTIITSSSFITSVAFFC